jgi:predicted N-acetyltransferase YhbS
MLPTSQIARARELPLSTLATIYQLQTETWPPPADPPPYEQRFTEFVERMRGLGTIHALVWDGAELAAHARFHHGEVFTLSGPLAVGCLAAVCVAPAYRGRGLGRDVVRALFDFVDAGSPPVMLFQTGVPEFYERLGGRLVFNRFVNSRDAVDPEGNPWHEQHVMIYPASFDWPEGVVDIQTKGW